MFIAMNRFKVQAGREDDFEKIWRERESYLDEVTGFEEFHLLRGATEGEETTYLSHSKWDSRKAFEDWTQSESFKRGHSGAGSSRGVILGHPQFEGYEAVI